MPERDHRAVCNTLALRLERVLLGSESLAALLAEPECFPETVQSVQANLWHFAADADIRAMDPEYRRMQEVSLHTLIARLRRGAPAQELAQVSFLRHVGP